MRLSVLALLLATGSAFAGNSKNVKLEMSLTVDGHTTNPKAVTLYDTTATISQLDKNGNGIEIAVTPSRNQDRQVVSDLVNINLIVSKVTSGQKKILANSKIVTKIGMSADLRQKSEGHELSLTVVPSEIQ